jgi:hypothetical protein
LATFEASTAAGTAAVLPAAALLAAALLASAGALLLPHAAQRAAIATTLNTFI